MQNILSLVAKELAAPLNSLLVTSNVSYVVCLLRLAAVSRLTFCAIDWRAIYLGIMKFNFAINDTEPTGALIKKSMGSRKRFYLKEEDVHTLSPRALLELVVMLTAPRANRLKMYFQLSRSTAARTGRSLLSRWMGEFKQNKALLPSYPIGGHVKLGSFQPDGEVRTTCNIQVAQGNHMNVLRDWAYGTERVTMFRRKNGRMLGWRDKVDTHRALVHAKTRYLRDGAFLKQVEKRVGIRLKKIRHKKKLPRRARPLPAAAN